MTSFSVRLTSSRISSARFRSSMPSSVRVIFRLRIISCLPSSSQLLELPGEEWAGVGVQGLGGPRNTLLPRHSQEILQHAQFHSLHLE